MYTAAKFTNLFFFKRLFPGLNFSAETKRKIMQIRFMASESTAGFLISKNNFLRKLKENDILIPAENLPTEHVLITDKEARSVGLLG